MPIPHVERGRSIAAFEQNKLIDAVNDNTTAIAVLQSSPGGSGGVDHQYVDDSIAAHVTSPTPHPIYDDTPSLTLLFENGLV